MLTIIINAAILMVLLYVTRRKVAKLKRENARLLSLIKGMRKEMDKMVRRPF